MDTQLTKLNDEVDALVKEILAEKNELKSAEGDKASDLRTSLTALRAEKAARSATRDQLLLLAATPAPGKNTGDWVGGWAEGVGWPFRRCCPPPLYMQSYNTPLDRSDDDCVVCLLESVMCSML